MWRNVRSMAEIATFFSPTDRTHLACFILPSSVAGSAGPISKPTDSRYPRIRPLFASEASACDSDRYPQGRDTRRVAWRGAKRRVERGPKASPTCHQHVNIALPRALSPRDRRSFSKPERVDETIVLQCFECKPNVHHGTPARSTNRGASRQGTARLMRIAVRSL